MTHLNTKVISKAVIEMQQALSEKFGIPTFNLQGQVSTIPQTRPLNTSINVNTGATGLSVSAFNELLKKFTPTKFPAPPNIVYSPRTGVTEQPQGTPLEPGEQILRLGTTTSLFSNIAPYTGYIVLGVAALIGLSLLKRA